MVSDGGLGAVTGLICDKKTGKVFARGEVVVIDESFGVRVTEVVDESK